MAGKPRKTKADTGRRLEELPIVSLIPYARNSRTHSPEQISQIAASIQEFGFTVPVLIDADSGIIAGHGRVLAAEQLGMATVPCLRLAKGVGLSTWVSFEPVIDPEAVYRLIDATRDFVDLYKVGRLNYHKHAATIDWPAFRDEVVAILEAAGKKYYLKEDLRNAR